MIRRFGKGLGRLFGAAFFVVALYLLGAAVGGLIPGRSADVPAGDDVEIALLYGPIHVDFLLPATAQTREALQFARTGGVQVEDAGVGYFIVGWGARDFYTTTPQWADLSARATLRAITGDASVLRVDVVQPNIAFDQLPRLSLSADQYAALLAEIAATATPDAIGVEAEGHRATSGFVEARGRFHILRTCNTWVGRVLRGAGVPMGAWTPTPYAVRLSLWRAGVR
ncbi:TIGR02117 family protein [Gymnodinialimonas sp. 57CJ19]|uniref:TIGR02117 family protein n=1 Tax=Gymnodinialimonas sp. 57CJ19 TaxID=3138498 RepID=UPI0031344F9F